MTVYVGPLFYHYVIPLNGALVATLGMGIAVGF
jgi:hypothetical protein